MIYNISATIFLKEKKMTIENHIKLNTHSVYLVVGLYQINQLSYLKENASAIPENAD